MIKEPEKEPKKIKEIEKEQIAEKEIVERPVEIKEKEEERESLVEKEKIIEELEKKIAKMKELSPELEEKAKKKASQIGVLDKEEKLKLLLGLAEQKGLFFAMEVARNMKDPYILDSLRDILAEGGFYKKFWKK